MRCEDVLARLETGHAYDRWLARKHAASCTACGVALRSFEEVKRFWATPEPLSARHQLSWKAATFQFAVHTPTRYKVPLSIAGFALAASLLLVLYAWRPEKSLKNNDQQEVAIQVEISRPPVTILPLSEEFIGAEFAPLEGKLKALEHEIDQIQATAEKREAQFLLAGLIQQHSKREVTTP